ncbi:MAG: DUF1501 domain-containing protein [Planctomycetes bacterium]|nr:DUF1501 domain-containing protein [Planctomycetota bacterium]
MRRPGTADRRDFLRLGAGSLGLSSLTSAASAMPASTPERGATSCIILFLVGGPSQLDTWDMKPAAPAEIRGPFRPVCTSVPGMQICEHFPRMAAMARRFSIVRSVSHDSSPIHETGQQLLQTGGLAQAGVELPHVGSVVAHQLGARRGMPPFVIVPGQIGNTGVNVGHGQGSGVLGHEYDPRFHPVASIHDRDLRRYGRTHFGRSCLQARRLVERGVQLVTVNMFDTVFDKVTWDCHADGVSLPTTLDDYRTTLCPTFDSGYSALLEDLHDRGMLDSTLVVAMGEFGRTPRLNARGGRDHWPAAWSILFAGGGVHGGQVIGATNHIGAEVRDRPVSPPEVSASILSALGLSVLPAQPIHELLG